MIKLKGSGIFSDRDAMGKLPLHKKMGEYFPQQSDTNPNLKKNTEITEAGVVDDETAQRQALKQTIQPEKAQKTKTKYTTEGMVAGGDPSVEEKGRIVTGKIGGKKVKFTVKGQSVYRKGQYVGSYDKVMASLDQD